MGGAVAAAIAMAGVRILVSFLPAGDVKDKPNSPAAEMALWWPTGQTPVDIHAMSVAVRGSSDPALLVDDLRQAVRRLDPTLALADVLPMEQIADVSISTPRFALILVALFAGLAVSLAAVGMYGVIAYAVSRRTHELGLRMALGAKPADVLRLVMRQGLGLASIGVICGLVGALALGRILRSLLFRVSAADPLTFVLVAALAIAIAALACYLPARRATAVDPVHALRSQ
jgi:ABC-type antimicrobial peptide transport system permease subunit